MTKATVFSVLVVLALSASDGAAQDRDPFQTFAQGLSIGGALLHKEHGDQVLPPQPFPANPPAATTPVYTMDAIFGPGWDLEIDAMASGNDIMPIDFDAATGVARIVPVGQAPGWAAVILAVEDPQPPAAATGSPEFVLRERYGNVGAVTGDLFSYWFEGNNGLPGAFVDRAHFTAGREHMGLDTAARIRAVDTFMPIIIANEGLVTTPSDGVVKTPDRLFFSITPAAAGTIAEYWDTDFASRFQPGTSLADVNAAAVLAIQWQPSTRSWSPIEVRFSSDVLGLVADDDIDALAYEPIQRPDYLVFSLAPASATQAASELLFADVTATPPIHVPLLTISGGDVGPLLRLSGGGDVTGVCFRDPENTLSQWTGTPIDGSPLENLGLSIERFRSAITIPGVSPDFFSAQVSDIGTEPGLLALFLADPSVTPLVWGMHPGVPAIAFAGGPGATHEFIVPTPLPLAAPAPLRAQAVFIGGVTGVARFSWYVDFHL